MAKRQRFWLAAMGLSAAIGLATAAGASAWPRSSLVVPSRANAVSGTITFLTEAQVKRAWDILIPNFQRVYPNVEIKPTYILGGTARGTVMATQFQSGNAPDVVMLGAGRATAPSLIEYAQAGYLADLSTSPWAKRVPPWVKPLVTLKGKIYGWMQRSITAPIVIYNKDLYQSLGLRVPKTFAQFLGVCRTIRQKAPNLVPLGFIGALPDARGAMAFALASSEVYGKDPNWNVKRAQGKVTFQTTPGWHTAVQHIVDLKNAGCFSPSVAADSPTAVIGQMVTQQAVMLWQSDQGASLIKTTNPKLHIDMFVPPATTQAGTFMTVFPFDTLAVNKKSRNLAAARAFVDFIAREKQSRLFSKILGEESPFDYQRALNPKIGAKALDDIHQFAAPYVTKGKIRISGQSTFPSTGSYVAIATTVQGLFTGQSSVDDVLKAADDNWGK
jgi:raffinose/stachyose/melibiose transport system substrate-binding protein